MLKVLGEEPNHTMRTAKSASRRWRTMQPTAVSALCNALGFSALPRVEAGGGDPAWEILARHLGSGRYPDPVVGNRSRDLFKQKLWFTTVDAVAFHHKPDQGIVYRTQRANPERCP